MSRQARTLECQCGEIAPVVRLTDYTFSWRCDGCKLAGTLAWAVIDPPPEFDGETQPNLFPTS